MPRDRLRCYKPESRDNKNRDQNLILYLLFKNEYQHNTYAHLSVEEQY